LVSVFFAGVFSPCFRRVRSLLVLRAPFPFSLISVSCVSPVVFPPCVSLAHATFHVPATAIDTWWLIYVPMFFLLGFGSFGCVFFFPPAFSRSDSSVALSDLLWFFKNTVYPGISTLVSLFFLFPEVCSLCNTSMGFSSYSRFGKYPSVPLAMLRALPRHRFPLPGVSF